MIARFRSIPSKNSSTLLALVAVGGVAGAGGRVYLETAMASKGFPTATLIINLAGAFILGMVVTMAQSSFVQNAAKFRALFGTGICGGFTTFSTATLETFNLIRHSQFGLGIEYLILTVIGGVLAVYFGIVLSRFVSLVNRRVRDERHYSDGQRED
ncbi:MAG: fluoride efflux transporter CrcB [Acidimicrobiaceae bacterium]|nr:fluoride efflux transporter CrcB [Acidimicrobiaceae bacterium]